MTVEAFSEACALSGYADKKRAIAWCMENGITEPTETDFMRVYNPNLPRDMCGGFREIYTGHGQVAKTTKRYQTASHEEKGY